MIMKRCVRCNAFFGAEKWAARFCSDWCRSEGKREREAAKARKSGKAYKPKKGPVPKFEPWSCRIDMGEAGVIHGLVVSAPGDFEHTGEVTAWVKIRGASTPDLFPVDCLERCEVWS